MFLPLIIAILLGFASPSDTNNTSNSDTTVNVNGDETPGDDTGGEVGHTPIRP